MEMRRGDSCNVSSVTMSVHTGAHVDAPYHYDDSGLGVAQMDLEPYLGRARVIALESCGSITAADLEQRDWRDVVRVLFKTSASAWPEDRFQKNYTSLAEDGADYLGQMGLRLVGTDAPSIDAFESKDLRSHRTLLKHRVAVLEGIRLGAVPPGDYELICLPLKLQGADGSPVRAVLRDLP
jgi:arylformamidase